MFFTSQDIWRIMLLARFLEYGNPTLKACFHLKPNRCAITSFSTPLSPSLPAIQQQAEQGSSEQY